MKLVVVAVGHRMPAWVNAGFEEYARRMPRELPLQLVEVKAEPRSGGKAVAAMQAAEAQRIEAALPSRCRRVILDERALPRVARCEYGSRSHRAIKIVVGGRRGTRTPDLPGVNRML